jgi:isoleucyl-tRNA synthetase
VKIRCKKCSGKASRIPDVGNPWLDAGIVAYSTLQYRQNHDYWKKWFPAHFITESFQGQFRNWFYAMLAESTILENRTPFLTCLGHGQVLAEDGQEMHKSWGNAIWFDEAAETMGADVMRWIYSSSKPENNVRFGYSKASEVRRLFFMTLLNVYNFFYQYATLDQWVPEQQPKNISLLDKWILSKLNKTLVNVTKALDDYDSYRACNEIELLVDILSKWYVRRSRRRFWKTEADDEKKAAYSTLYNCLKTVILMMAPMTPHLSEALYQCMVRPVESESPESIHHCKWPDSNSIIIDEELISEMDFIIKISSMGRSARNKQNIKLRQPLDEALVVVQKENHEILEKFSTLIKEEINVKKLHVSTDRTLLQSLKAKPIPAKIGKKYGKLFHKVVDAINNLSSEEANKLQKGKIVTVNVEGTRVAVIPEEVELEYITKEDYSVHKENNLLVGVKTQISDNLETEGLARDVVRRIQALRKEADFKINDQIITYYEGDEEILEVFKEEKQYIKVETLTDEFIEGNFPSNATLQEYEIDGRCFKLGILKK